LPVSGTLDIRFVVANLDHGSAEWLCGTLYCARGQAENLVELHRAQFASDRTSCPPACASQVRLVLHTAFWLTLVRNAIPKSRGLAKAEFATLRLKLTKIAACVVERASRVRLAFAAACPNAVPFASLPAALNAARFLNDGAAFLFPAIFLSCSPEYPNLRCRAKRRAA
jgi:hypothetical protein